MREEMNGLLIKTRFRLTPSLCGEKSSKINFQPLEKHLVFWIKFSHLLF